MGSVLAPDILEPRDILRALAILDDASHHIALSIEGDCRNAAGVANSERSRALLDGFINERDSVRSLRAMGVVCVEADGLATYRSQL